MKLTASAIINAIYICLFIAIISMVFLFVFNYQNFLFLKLEETRELIYKNRSATDFYLNKINENKISIGLSGTLTSDHFSNSISEYKPWGVFNILTIRSNLKNKLSKSYLIGSKLKDSSDIFSLYISDNNRLINLKGKTSLNGKIYLPNGEFSSSPNADISVKGKNKFC